jgi:hypothetical protein
MYEIVYFNNVVVIKVAFSGARSSFKFYAVKTNQDRQRDLHKDNTRNATDLSLPTHHLSIYEKKASYRGALFYNNMPGHLKKVSGQRLSRQLSACLEDRPFYSVKEFLERALD